MKNLIIHGHFYQPPRENPWTGIIEDQKTASPYPNWNTRICRESYEANAYSPLLDKEGRIESFCNNYSFISYNMGPTLLNWLQQEAGHVYDKIIEADRISQENLGFGNAVAQVYNHMILPLAGENDRKTQILWGLEDFKSRFNRDSQGMWLSEAAINPDTAEELVRSGIRYTILSPWQSRRFRFDHSEWVDTNQYNPVLWQHPWRLSCPSGNLNIYFYHPHLSSEISFNHLLRDADYFYSRATGELEESGSDFISMATDGEIYGHHEPLGNMGLTAFLKKVRVSEEYRMVNFSWMDHNVQPAGEVELIKGEEGRGSSWSCSHGVSRWYKDCGCSTGGQEGWNQNWRGPLREALKDLESSADRIYKKGMTRLTAGSPEEIRNNYIHVLTGKQSTYDFFRKHCPGRDSDSDRVQFYRLLEGQRFKMFMFTSCAWFFADLSGLEPLQNLMYAARLIDLYTPYYSTLPEADLLERLSAAQSNIPEKGNGAVLFTISKYDRKKEVDLAALSLIIRHYYGIEEFGQPILKGEIIPGQESGEISHDKGTLNIKNPLTGEFRSIPYQLEGTDRLFSHILLLSREQALKYTPENISRRDKEALMKQLCLMELKGSLSISRKYSGIINQLDEWMKLRLPEGEDLEKSVKALLHYALREVTFLMESGNPESWNCFVDLFKKNRIWKITLPEDLNIWLGRVIENELFKQTERGAEQDQKGILNRLGILLDARQDSSHIRLNPSLSGRIINLIADSKDGIRLLNQMEKEKKMKILEILNISESFQLPESAGF